MLYIEKIESASQALQVVKFFTAHDIVFQGNKMEGIIVLMILFLFIINILFYQKL